MVECISIDKKIGDEDMESVFNAMAESIIVLNKDDIVEFCNINLLKELSFSYEDVLNKSFSNLIFNKEIYTNSNWVHLISKDKEIKIFKYKIVHGQWKNDEAKFLILNQDEKYSRRELEVILDKISYMAWIKGIDGRYVYVNDEFAKIARRSKNNIIGKFDRELWELDEAKLIEKEDNKVIQSKGTIENEELITADKSRFWFYMVKSVLLDSNGDVMFTYGIGNDVTDKKANQQTRRILEKEKEAENVRNEFFNNISHEFKTPLNVVLSSTQLLNNYVNNRAADKIEICKLKNYIKIIQNNSYRLLRMVNNLIDITKIDVGECELKVDSINIVSLVEDIVFDVAGYVNKHGGIIIFDTDIEEKIIICDIEKIERIILNLISNSIKYSKGHSEIIIKVKSLNNGVEILVKDNGIGIEKQKIDKIFERFVQSDRSLSRKQEGSGIGLSLVKSLVEMHKGKINIKSKLNKGTEVKITLPDGIVDADSNIQLSFPIFKQHNTIENCSIEFSDIYL